jgi:hypothetical protein
MGNAARRIEMSLEQSAEPVTAEVQELIRQFDAATEALAKYGSHGPDCPAWDPGGSCNCGYSASLKEAGLP